MRPHIVIGVVLALLFWDAHANRGRYMSLLNVVVDDVSRMANLDELSK